MIDSHCHLYFDQYNEDRESVLVRARAMGVEAFINIGIDLASSTQALALAQDHPDVYATVGYHPHSAQHFDTSQLSGLRKLALDERVVAIGEVGLDYFKSTAQKTQQFALFEAMLNVAGELKQPVVVHSRDAYRDTVKCLYRACKQHPDLKGVIHCYSYNKEGLAAILDLNFNVSFTCNVTYPKSHDIREAVKAVPMDRFLIETDAPYLAPQAVRGKRNEPAFLSYLVDQIAEIKGVSSDLVKDETTANARKLFNLDR